MLGTFGNVQKLTDVLNNFSPSPLFLINFLCPPPDFLIPLL